MEKLNFELNLVNCLNIIKTRTGGPLEAIYLQNAHGDLKI